MTTTTRLVIDPLAIATQGYLVTEKPFQIDTLSVATLGFYVVITEEIIDEIIPTKLGGAADATLVMGPYDHYREERKKKKRITATTIIGGVTYAETIEVDDITITASDVHIEISNSATKPQLKITVMRGKK